MREILFRGKRKDNEEWVEGYYVHLYDGKRNESHRIYSGTAETDCGEFYEDFFEVDPETVGQFTGLYDGTKWEDLTEKERSEFTRAGNFPSEWNGKKIFEGDLLNGFEYPFRGSNGKHNYFAEVCWFDNCLAFGLYTHKHPNAEVLGISEGNTELMEDLNGDNWEVIGNIHDNPDLLSAK